MHHRTTLLSTLLAYGALALSAQSTDAAKPQAETKMTPQQTQELFRSVDEVMQFVSKDSNLAIKHPVKRVMMSREQVNAMLVKKFNEDQSAKRMQRSELVLKKFGLIDRDFQLRPFMVSLLTEQIAGFYDAKTRTMHLLDWIPADQQKTVMAHELTHALQDQRVDLNKWGDVTKTDVSKNAKTDREHIATDEASTAREAVTEGQAMVTFIDYMLKDTGKSIASDPTVAERASQMQTESTNDSPILSRAPLLLQQSLLFPYSEGLNFEIALITQKGIDTAFGGALDNPPNTSREIINPNEYLAHKTQPVLVMPDVHPLLDKDWAPYDVGVLGQFDVRVTAELFGGKSMAAAIAPAWDGGVYYAAQKRDATDAQKATTASIAFVYYSQWKSAETARAFMRVYSNYLGRKYRALKVVSGTAQDDAQVYSTEEGDVVLTQKGKSVFVSEGFDRATAAKLEEMIRGSQGVGPVRMANEVMHDPAMDLAGSMASFGLMRAGMNSGSAVAK